MSLGLLIPKSGKRQMCFKGAQIFVQNVHTEGLIRICVPSAGDSSFADLEDIRVVK